MLVNKEVLSLALVASSDFTKPSLGGVRIEPDGSGVATDGRILVKFTPSLEHSTEKYPVVAGCDLADTEPLQPFTLDAKSCGVIKKAIPKRSVYPPLTSTFRLDVARTNAGNRAIVEISDAKNVQTFSLEKIEGDFPDYEVLIPKAGLGEVKIGLAVAVLKKLIVTLEALNVEYFSAEIRGKEEPIRIEAQSRGDTGAILAVVMPRRLPR